MKRILLNWIGVILAVTGAVVLFTWDGIINSIIHKKLSLTPESQVFPIWRNSDDPIYLEMYLFNCTNVHEFSGADFKPNVVDVGPFIFKEFVERVDLVWNENNTISFRQNRTWYFDKENSADINQNITTLNVVPVAASYKSRFAGAWAAWSLSTSMKMLEKSIWTTRPAREYLFDGYTDPLMTLSSVFSGDQTDKMGFFYRKNGSIVPDGYFNMETGAEDMSTIGLLRYWNFKNTSYAHDEGCDDISGYMGNFYKPGMTKEDTFTFFSGELCRSFKFEFLDEVEEFGIKGYRFVPSKTLFDNGYNYEESKCNCGGECLAPGVLNISRCNKGAPMFASFPHLLDADPSYLKNITGLTPSHNRSQFYILMEPTLGIPIHLSAHLQYNILLQPNSKLSLFADVPTLMYPLIYVKKRFLITPESVQKVKLILYLPMVGTISAVALILLGLIMVSISLMPYFLSKVRRSSSIRKIDITTNATFSKKQEVDFKKNEKDNKTEDAISDSEYEKLRAAENVDNLEKSKETDILS